MDKERHIAVQPVSHVAFAAFGRVVGLVDERPPDVTGDGWACWCRVGELRDAVPLSVGIVRTDPRPLLIEALERHLDREEWVYVLNQSMIQVVALSMPAAPHQPSAESVKAFLLEPGQGVIMDRGVWHSAGLPVGDQSVYYGFVLGRSRSDTGAEGNPWVPFAGHERVVLEVQPRSGR